MMCLAVLILGGIEGKRGRKKHWGVLLFTLTIGGFFSIFGGMAFFMINVFTDKDQSRAAIIEQVEVVYDLTITSDQARDLSRINGSSISEQRLTEGYPTEDGTVLAGSTLIENEAGDTTVAQMLWDGTEWVLVFTDLAVEPEEAD